MAPLENGSFQPSVWDEAGRHRVDSLMRALLYITQQVGRPVSEADIRRLADEAYGGALPDFVQTDASDLELIESTIPDDYTQIDEMAGASPVNP